MSDKEKKFRSLVVSMLKPVGAFPVENLVGEPGCPDVCTTLGWLELKIASRPARATTRVSVDLRPAQALWLRRWRRLGGRAWTLTLLGESLWLLHDGAWSADHLGSEPELRLISEAIMVRENAPTSEELILHLMSPMHRKGN